MNSQTKSNRIVVGVDSSEFSSDALGVAGRMASMLQEPLVVVSCIGKSNQTVASRFEESPNRFTAQLDETVQQQVEETLDRAFHSSRPKDLTVTVRFEDPATALIEESKTAQLLVVGRRRSGGILSRPLGSVSQACVAHAHCPVLVVPETTAPPMKENHNGK